MSPSFCLVVPVKVDSILLLEEVHIPIQPSMTAAATAPPTSQMSNISLQGNAAPKGTAKRDALCAAELQVQEMWEREKAFECNPSDDDKFIVTFPYPYSNGHLHLGHAFSLTKAVFRAQFERNRGKNSLFPFAFHCTGMPIQAVSFT